MSHEETSFNSRMGESVALKSVYVDGQLDGLMLRVIVRQCYRNETDHSMETVYTFPLAWGVTLLGLNVELAGKRLVGTVIEKKEATGRYEKAIDDGDTPVMVEKSGAGLYTANLGNLKAGEEAAIELEYAQLLRFDQGRVRLSIPTTIAPRYGDAHAQGILAAHETASVNPLAEYPFTLKLNIHGPVGQANLSCPSHTVSVKAIDQGMAVTLERGAMLDRDFILNLEGLTGRSFAVSSPDGEGFAVLASFCPALKTQPDAPLRLKILVDCSGSMGGDSIKQARFALHEVAQALTLADHVSYSRFGSTVRHVIPNLELCTPKLIGQILSRAIQATEADMGGTELHEALQSTFGIKSPQADEEVNDILLITDGDVWEIDAIVAAASQSRHRIFAVGVGSSPAESLLRDLAEQTGGSCELVSPSEDIAQAILRMFRRMRAARDVKIQVDWGQTPEWQSALPRQLIDGETVHVFATFSAKPETVPKLTWDAGGGYVRSEPQELTPGVEGIVARMGGARQLLEVSSDEGRLALALKYQLISSHTNLFLIYIRAEDDKATGLPQLQQIEQMQAAGWGGFGSVLRSGLVAPPVVACYSIAHDFGSLSAPSVWRANRSRMSFCFDDIDDFETPAFLRKQADDGASISKSSLSQLVSAFNQAAMGSVDFAGAMSVTLDTSRIEEICNLVGELTAGAGDMLTAYAVLLEWLVDHAVVDEALNRHAVRLIRAQLAGIDDDVKVSVIKHLNEIGLRVVMQGKVAKNNAIERLLRENRARGLEKHTTHFASINAGKEVWWYDISRKKVISGQSHTLNILAYDHRSNELHHLVVPTQFLRDNLEKLFIRQDKDTISLELSASRSNFLQDVRSGGGRIQFSQFLKG